MGREIHKHATKRSPPACVLLTVVVLVCFFFISFVLGRRGRGRGGGAFNRLVCKHLDGVTRSREHVMSRHNGAAFFVAYLTRVERVCYGEELPARFGLIFSGGSTARGCTVMLCDERVPVAVRQASATPVFQHPRPPRSFLPVCHVWHLRPEYRALSLIDLAPLLRSPPDPIPRQNGPRLYGL